MDLLKKMYGDDDDDEVDEDDNEKVKDKDIIENEDTKIKNNDVFNKVIQDSKLLVNGNRNFGIDVEIDKEILKKSLYSNLTNNIEGPSDPRIGKRKYTAEAGSFIDHAAFDQQYHSFLSSSGSIDPKTGHSIFKSVPASIRAHNNQLHQQNQQLNQNMSSAIIPYENKKKKPKLKSHEFTSDEIKSVDFGNLDSPWIDKSSIISSSDAEQIVSEEQKKYLADLQAKRILASSVDGNSEGIEVDGAVIHYFTKLEHELFDPKIPISSYSPFSSKWLGGENAEYDYQGRSWITRPSHIKPIDDYTNIECSIPQECVHQWTMHTKGVQAIRFFPVSGHILLSAGLDGKIFALETSNERKILMQYSGHSMGIKDISFNNDGTQFLSCSWDNKIALWDTETGQAISSYSNGSNPNCVKFYPLNDKIFCSGHSNRHIVTYDILSGKKGLEYTHHMGAVKQLLFIDEGKKFVSTSDDKRILTWDWGIPVPISYISEADMHSVPTMALHPNGKSFVGQSMDNQILVFRIGEKTKLNRNKSFTANGFMSAGYACEISISPNGQFVASGDGRGNLFFWDWKSSKLHRKFKDVHFNHSPCISTAWHPALSSTVATCGWDGVIKLFE